jgi:sugar/nucleoside kinase (ribokinase family)
MDRKGICVAGNMIVDILYPVRGLPRPGELTTIQEGISRAIGGALCNVAGDLAVMDPSLPLTALGRIGTDSEGDFVLEQLRRYPSLDLSMIRREGVTSFTVVMADEISRERTFFHYRGANALFCGEDIDWDRIDAVLLHIGYILLLDSLDGEDPEYGTKMARLLCHARERGIRTSIDVVSEAGDRFKGIVLPALKYADYCVINEVEAEQITGIKLRDAKGRLIADHIPRALKKIRQGGVSTWAVIHCPEGGYGLDGEGNYAESPAVDLPPDYIKGKVGAGDAFCAGVLCAAYRGESLERGLDLGNAAAVASLSRPGGTEGMLPLDELRGLREKLRPAAGLPADR